MQARIAAILLVASAATQAFVCMWIALLIPSFFRAIYNLKSPDDLLIIMPTITRLISDQSWIIAVAFAIVAFVALIALRWRSEKVVNILAVGLCAQGIVTWLTMFSFCYDGFLGDMSLHRKPEFSGNQFLRFAGGVFPVTLLLILAPMIAALWQKDVFTSSD